MANPTPSQACPAALAAWSLVLFGCHGWMPAASQPFVLVMLGAILLAGAGPARFGTWAFFLRFVPLLAGIVARQLLGSDLPAILGLFLGCQLVAEGAGRPWLQRARPALLSLAILHVTLSTAAGFHVEEWLSGVTSAVASWFGDPVRLDPVFGGTRTALVVAIWIATCHTGSGWQRLWRMGLAAAVAVGASVAVANLAALLPPFGSKTANDPMLAMLAAQLPWVPFALGVLTTIVLSRSPEGVPGRFDRWFLVGSAAAAAIAVLASLPPASLRPARSVVFFRPGFSNWETANPSLEGAGPYSTGMMGSLPMFARALGQRAQLVDVLDEAVLADTDVLVLVNQVDSLGESAGPLVTKWVAAGGHLVVVGDHTLFGKVGTDRFEMFVNEPLAASAIRLMNNSSDHLTTAFRDATVTSGLFQSLGCVADNPYSPIIGAGLAVGWPARPMVIGRYGFGDEGRLPTVADDDAIGDLTWNVGERLGGMVLLAEQQVGTGRVTAVGDTTGFHNIARSSAWPAIAKILTSASNESASRYWFVALVLVGLVLVGMASAGTLGDRWRLLRPRTGTLWLVLLALPSVWPKPTAGNPLVGETVPLVILDTAVRPAGKLGDWTADGYLTLISGALRTGALPLFTSTLEHGIPPAARVVLLSSPRVDPGATYHRDLLDWVARGGHLVIAADFAAQPVLNTLFQPLGCRIGSLVIGPQSVQVGAGGQGLVIRLEESWNLEFSSSDWSRIVYRGETTSMARRSWGKGLVTVITDRQFLMNRNQENREVVRPHNLKFMMHLLGNPEGR